MSAVLLFITGVLTGVIVGFFLSKVFGRSRKPYNIQIVDHRQLSIINPSKAFAIAIASTFALIGTAHSASILHQESTRNSNVINLAQRRTPRTKTKEIESKPSEAETKEEISNIKSVFPLNINNAAFLDLSSGKSIPMKITQEEDGDLLITSSNKDFNKISVSPRTILEWRIGDNTQQTFDGGQAVASGGGFALGAIIGGGPAAPLLLLASPFLGMASGNRILPEWRIGMSRIIENGREQNLLVQTYSQEDATNLGQALKISTGLDAGVRRSGDEVSLLKSSLTEAMVNKLEEYKKALLVEDRRKPWCSSIDLSTESPERSKYLQQKKLVIDLYDDLGTKYVPDESANSEIKWAEYLESNPNMKKWAEANPEAAKSHKSCDK